MSVLEVSINHDTSRGSGVFSALVDVGYLPADESLPTEAYARAINAALKQFLEHERDAAVTGVNVRNIAQDVILAVGDNRAR